MIEAPSHREMLARQGQACSLCPLSEQMAEGDPLVAGAGAGASCTANGSGPLHDAGVTIPACRSLVWLLTAPMRMNASGWRDRLHGRGRRRHRDGR